VTARLSIGSMNPTLSFAIFTISSVAGRKGDNNYGAALAAETKLSMLLLD
jgi:hypothetical protein